MNERKNGRRPAVAVALIAGLASISSLGLATRAAADEGEWTDHFSFHGRIYADASWLENEDKGTNTKSDNTGFGTDVKRFYLEFGWKVDDIWSAKIVTDIGDKGTKRYDVFVKKAYLEAKFSPMAVLQIGSTDQPWIPFVEGLYGYRYLENTQVDRQGFGTSADWGVHLKGGDTFEYSVAVVNGRGYSDPTRSGSVDFEGRISFKPSDNFTFGVGGYSGKLGKDTDADPAMNTATRLNAAIDYKSDRFHIGGEYFQADDWKQVTSPSSDSSDGFSIWTSIPLSKAELFARYDQTDPSKDLNPGLSSDYYHVGVQFKPAKLLLMAIAYKHTTVDSGNGGTAAGVGSSEPNSKGESNELGVWFQYKW